MYDPDELVEAFERLDHGKARMSGIRMLRQQNTLPDAGTVWIWCCGFITGFWGTVNFIIRFRWKIVSVFLKIIKSGVWHMGIIYAHIMNINMGFMRVWIIRKRINIFICLR